MGTIRSELKTRAATSDVWSAIRDIGALHTRLVPGFVVDTKLETGARVVTFVNGVTLREPIVSLDDEARRLAWTHEGGRAGITTAFSRFPSFSTAQRLSSGPRTSCPTTSTIISRGRSRRAWRRCSARWTGSRREPYSTAANSRAQLGPEHGRWETKGLMTMAISPFLAALACEGPPADRAKDMDLYGWLIGSWETDTVRRLDDGATEKWTGEVHSGWVLEGRAIQDIWIRPRRPAPSTMYGTTLRIFDPQIDGWHIIWADPLNRDYSRQIGRPQGRDIIQIGEDSRGLMTRWRFTEITQDSFHWIGEERCSESDPWRITYEHFARRTNPSDM